MTTYNLIKQAIENKQCITCSYKGYLRKMTPHAIGTKNGNQQALFYQYGGQSSSGLSDDPKQNWRCISVDKIEGLIINTDTFQTTDNHSKRQTCADAIDIEVAY
jgi:hypothetical protein